MQIENVGDDKDSFSEFNSTVYENPNGSEARTQQQQPSSGNFPVNPFKVRTLTLVWITYAVIFGIPARSCSHLFPVP